jgi:hypothetical protein
LLVSIGVSAQTETESRYVWYKYLYGHRLDRMWADSVFHLPFTDTAVRPARPGALMMKSYDSSLAVWTGVYWASIGGAAGTVDATIVDGSANAVAGNAVFDALVLKADLASPTFTGTPAAPTAAPGTNTTQLATTAFVTNAVAAAGGGSVTLVSFTDDAVFDGTITNGSTTPALALTINAGSIALSKIANIADATILGNNSGGAGVPLALTVAQVKTMLGLTGTNSGDVTLAGQNYITIAGQVITAAAVNLSGTHVTGTLAAARFGALTGDVTNSAGSYATTIANLAITNAKVNDVGWSKITGTPTTILGYGITDAMQPNITNTMGANGRIVFSGLTTTSQVKIGSLELQGVSGTYGFLSSNIYYDGTNYRLRATGPGTILDLGGAAMVVNLHASGTANDIVATASGTEISYLEGIGVQIRNYGSTYNYMSFGSAAGSSGYGVRDSSGIMQFKPSGGSWTTFGTGSGGGAADLSYTASPTNGIVTSSTGTDATLTLATSTNAGLESPGQFAYVDSLRSGLIKDTIFTGPHLEGTTAANGGDSLFIDAVTETGTSKYLGFNGAGTWGLHSTTGFVTAPAGSTTEIQYNNAGAFGASANFTFNAGTLTVQTANSGVIIREYTAGNTYYGIYANTLSGGPGSNNYAFLFKKDGTESFLNASTSSVIAVAGTAELTATAGLVTVNDLKITDGTPTVGWVWTLTNVDGSGEWAVASGGAGSLAATLAIGNTTGAGIAVIYEGASGTGNNVSVKGTSAINNFASMVWQSTGANSSPSIDFSPQGTGFSAGNKATFTIYNTDVVADAANAEGLRFRASGATGYTINSVAFGTGTTRDILVQTASTSRMIFGAGGGITTPGFVSGLLTVDGSGVWSVTSETDPLSIHLTGTSTLTGDITIAGGASNSVFITGSGSELFKVTNTGAGFYAITADGSEYGMQSTAAELPLNLITDNTNTNAVRPIAHYTRSGVIGANGVGLSERWYLPASSTGQLTQAAELIVRYSDATLGSMDSEISFHTAAGGATPTERVVISDEGITIFNGVAPTTNASNGVRLYAEDVAASSELKVRDEAGNITTLGPHNFSGIPGGRSEEMAWSYYSERDGKYINVDMLKMARLLEKEFGVKLVYTGSTKELKK